MVTGRTIVGMAAAVILAGGVVLAASLPSNVRMPELSAVAKFGQAAFGKHCSTCHGADAGGTNSGPPLIHRIYHPGHHADMAFVIAARRGSRAHHWKFGDMPAVKDITDEEIAQIIVFVREVQRANGIF